MTAWGAVACAVLRWSSRSENRSRTFGGHEETAASQWWYNLASDQREPRRHPVEHGRTPQRLQKSAQHQSDTFGRERDSPKCAPKTYGRHFL
jgi:hypothetical protein